MRGTSAPPIQPSTWWRPWHLLEEGPRETLRAAWGCSDVQWQRGMAWAFQQAVGLVWHYVDSNPVMSHWGRRTLDHIARSAVT
jgi:hypothetical protein